MRSVLKRIFFVMPFCLIVIGKVVAAAPLNLSGSDFSNPYRKLAEFSRQFPQQKAYLHTDKTEYLSGETIWIKAYLVSARSHIPDTSSTNLFVEFINTRNEVIEFFIMRLEKGFSSGSIHLPDSLPGGNYQLKAYTNWMNNFSKEFFFTKDIYVHNPAEVNYVTRAEIRRNIRFNKAFAGKMEEMQFAFFPEGGDLVGGLENRVAFKAANALGLGQEASGALFDANGNQILEFSTFHDGMGLFSFTPAAGEIYTARIVFENGQRMEKTLPVAVARGYLLRVEPSPELIRVSVQANFAPADYSLSNDILLLAHTRGRVGYVEKARLVNGNFKTNILPGQFPGGITHITLFGPDEKPVAERLVFINDAFSDDVGNYVTWEKWQEDGLVVVDFLFDTIEGIPVTDGNFSLAVTENFSGKPQLDPNIVSYLLLTSDLGKTIPDPMYYLSDNSPERFKALELLMMTHGWRRFDWNNIIAGNFPEIKYTESKGLSIVGQVSPVSSARETGELNIEMSVGHAGQRDIMRTRTDREGFFAFTGLKYHDPFTALINVERDPRGRIYRVELFGRTRESSIFRPGVNHRKHLAVERGPEWRHRERPSFIKRLLSRPLSGQESRRTTGMYGTPDQVIYMEDLRVNYNSVLEILRDRVTGLSFVNGEIVLRGPSSIRLSNEPLFFIDEVQVNRFSFLNVPVPEIERIEVLRGPSTAILGSRGATGALFIYTRRAVHQQQFSYEYQLKGYHVPSEFFVSRINVKEYAENEVDRTIFWAPFISPDSNGRLRVRIPYPGSADNLNFRLEGIDSEGQVTFVYF